MLAPASLGGDHAGQGQRDHAELRQRLGHSALATGKSQQPTAGQPEAESDRRTDPQLLEEEPRECSTSQRAFVMCGREGDEEQEKRNGQTVVQAGLHVERLANPWRHLRTVDDRLPGACSRCAEHFRKVDA